MPFFLTACLSWIGLAILEMIHGILRAKFLAPKVGDLRSRQIGVCTGSIIIFTYTYFIFNLLHLASSNDARNLGLTWLILMIIFEFSVGHFIFRFPWKWLINDFNLLKGRPLAIGMIFLACAPWLIGRMKHLW